MEEMTDALNRAVLDLRNPRSESLGYFDPQRLSVGAEHRENGLGDGGRLLGAKRPGAERRQFDTEERVGVPDPLQITHGKRPVSFQVFLRVRLPTGSMGRMWNRRCLRDTRWRWIIQAT